jgi:hypothetical protein
MTACNKCANLGCAPWFNCLAEEAIKQEFSPMTGKYLSVYQPYFVINKYGNCKYFKEKPPELPIRFTKEGGNFNLIKSIRNLFK